MGLPRLTSTSKSMNFLATSLYFALLAAQVISCSARVGKNKKEVKAVCKTSMSYVLIMFQQDANDFHEKLPKIEKCIKRGGAIEQCLIAYPVAEFYESFMKHYKITDFSIETINKMHNNTCRNLVGYATKEKYSNDIPLLQYEVIKNYGEITLILDNLIIGFNFKTTDDAHVILKFKTQIELIGENFDEIYDCLGSGSEVDANFDQCIPKGLSLLKDLPSLMNQFGGPPDQVLLKILINQCLNIQYHLLIEEDAKIRKDIQADSSDSEKDDSKKADSKLTVKVVEDPVNEYSFAGWIIAIVAVVCVVGLAVAIARYLKAKKDVVADGLEETNTTGEI